MSLTRRSKRKGFALIIALSLMGFILLLMLSLGSMVVVESQTASLSTAQLRARLNAELAAVIALGNLQKFVGPDQRVTARADILDAPLASPIDGQAQWTGVWSSKEDTSDSDDVSVGLDNRKVQWLVSGKDPDAQVQINASNAIKLARKDTAVVNDSSEVAVLPEEVVSNNEVPAGKFAYWVSDEGVKARLNLDDPYLETTANKELYYRHAMPQQGDASAVLDSSGSRPYGVADDEVSIWKNETTSPERIASVGMLPILQPTADGDELEREFFHDFSTHSRSVLTNTKSGGLKRDLSTILLNLPADLQGPMFPPADPNDDGSTKPGDPGGPKWEQLADYYDYALQTKDDSVGMRMPTDDQVGIAPVVTRFNFIIQAFANQISIPANLAQPKATDFEYSVGMFPLITLWNPYDKDLVIPNLGLEVDMRGVFLNDRPNGSPVNILTLINASQFEHPRNQNRYMVRFSISGVTIPAGRAVNFSPQVNSYHAFKQPDRNVLKPGASAELIRGFFTRPKSITSGTAADVDFADVSLASSGAVHQQVTNLYSDPSFAEDDRFIALMTYGVGDIYRNHSWHSRRVVKLSDIDESDFSFILAEGESASAEVDPDDLVSPIDVDDIQRYARGITGSTLIMNLPRLDRHPDLQAVHLLNQMNPRSPVAYDQIHIRLMGGNWKNYGYRLYDSGRVAWWEGSTAPNYIDGVDGLYSYVGLKNKDDADGSDRMILFEIPDNPPLGIGQFMHANLMNVDEIANNFNDRFWGNNVQQSHTTPSYAIGNSSANIHLPLGITKLNFDDSDADDAFDGLYSNKNGDWKGAHYDYSYELNNVLWDDFFMSTILPDNRDAVVRFPLPNARMTAVDSENLDTDLLIEDRAASQLLLDGGFNINSTSVAAWESVLGALRDVDTLGEDPSVDTLVHNFSRFVEPMLESVSENPSYGNENDRIVSGFRNLSDSQISILATRIVDEIRTRRSTRGYPFLSLSEFINRSIDSDDISNPDRKRFAYQGTLQYAIDQAAINGRPAVGADGDKQVGNGLWEGGYSSLDVPSSARPYLTDSLEAIENRPLAEGTPGFLTQADVLSKIGSILTPRSDTFVIRAYGGYDDSFSGDSLGEAYCEMVVQRKPDYIDSTDEAYEEPTANDNITFGRRFEVVSFRWLDSSEI